MAETRVGNELWSTDAILRVENRILQLIIEGNTPDAVDAAVSYADYLRFRGLNAENYPVFLKMLKSQNPWVLEALLGPNDPFDLLADVPPNRYILSKCFELLGRPRAGIHPTALAAVLGTLRRAYADPRDGYRLHPVSVAEINNLGKHLDEAEGQNHRRNRALLDVLDDIGSLEGSRLDDAIDKIARQAVRIRGHFLDNARSLKSCLPSSLLASAGSDQPSSPPARVFVD